MPKVVTLNDLERVMANILRYFDQIDSSRGQLRQSGQS